MRTQASSPRPLINVRSNRVDAPCHRRVRDVPANVICNSLKLSGILNVIVAWAVVCSLAQKFVELIFFFQCVFFEPLRLNLNMYQVHIHRAPSTANTPGWVLFSGKQGRHPRKRYSLAGERFGPHMITRKISRANTVNSL